MGKDTTEYYLLTKDHVSVSEFEGKEILKVEAEGLTKLANAAMRDVSFLLRPEHQAQVASILSDPEASENAAAYLRLPRKGRIQAGADADLVLLDPELELRTVLAQGQVMVKDGLIQRWGTFEQDVMDNLEHKGRFIDRPARPMGK